MSLGGEGEYEMFIGSSIEKNSTIYALSFWLNIIFTIVFYSIIKIAKIIFTMGKYNISLGRDQRRDWF